MSENYRYYIAKMADKRDRPVTSPGLRLQLEEIFRVVRQCEATWRLEERIERQR